MNMLEKMSVAMAVCEMRRNGMSEVLCAMASADPETVAVAVENYGPQARAALLAIREPSGAVLDAGESHDEGGWGAPASAEVHWQSMIDAILNEST